MIDNKSEPGAWAREIEQNPRWNKKLLGPKPGCLGCEQAICDDCEPFRPTPEKGMMTRDERIVLTGALSAIDAILEGLSNGEGVDHWERFFVAWLEGGKDKRQRLAAYWRANPPAPPKGEPSGNG